mmetsp:Transcript_26841/g.61795  ORF Transcript_26841/g.61795 Transcript_26841/m.61795 type:complete len:425 (-) Transcript_26841:122-1396(-)|eukprot:CAMPEP_0113304372 /NCGR_PEP_ID=MMETSP0010_2-20120614/4424_1 /TAXON_ID=216773 ORGANISM="Corethron hystrix, Strain 308" /NCGR_SAMPLE_ID=MMETSP0010_2 /ASSEMBLY_ACC=CAM_ASM_000155 /LENGTH=424 /DNA_ID=CAMNT_0000158575 /DNA_START=113 /DNA_END=1387 /DNA_ORIENTATION=- /assembly_acc=CAM_ASM_000155
MNSIKFSLLALWLLHPFTRVNSFLARTYSALHVEQQAWLKSSLQSTEVDIAEGTASSGDYTVREQRKEALLSLLRCPSPVSAGDIVRCDPVLVDPNTKKPLYISATSPNLNDRRGVRQSVRLSANSIGGDSESAVYGGRTDTFYDLLNPVDEFRKFGEGEEGTKTVVDVAKLLLLPLVPPPLRTNLDSDYIPMRDLFTSPSVSYAYERGWRQGFAAAGFPGVDEEFSLAQKYFEKSLPTDGTGNVLVDMSCATGLFTRKFAASGRYDRVIGADYSDAMLTEARRRIVESSLGVNGQGDTVKGTSGSTTLDLVRLDVGNIPMATGSVDVLHAGAAMHCWPDLDGGLEEIHRVLKVGGRYFATTFLSNYFRQLQSVTGETTVESRPFQYFEDSDVLKDLVIKAGFDADKVSVEVLGQACAVIRCEK